MHEVHDALPVLGVCGRVQPRASERDARIGRDAHHLGHHQRRAAERAGTEVHQVEVVRRAAGGAVHVHRREDDAIRERQVAKPEWREHRRRRTRRLRARRRTAGEPALHPGHVPGVTQPKVLVADTLAAREQAVHELLGRQPDVALHVLEPLHRIARGILQAERLDHPLVLVALQCAGHVIRFGDPPRQRDRVFHRELRSGSDGEVRRMRRVADEHDVVVKPAGILHAHEARPRRRRAMRGVAHQPVLAEPFAEQRLAGGDRLLGVHPVQTSRAP